MTIARSVAAFLEFWSFPFLRLRWARAALLLLLLAICVLRAAIGLHGTQAFSQQAFLLLNGAWRMLHGQHPHLDFYSVLGPIAYLPTALGLWMSRGAVDGLTYGQCLAGLVLALWSYLLSRKRLADLPAVLFCLATLVTATAPSALGFSALRESPATLYNRYGYALLALLLVEAFAHWRPLPPRDQFLGGLSSGAVVAIAISLKITFGCAALVLLLALALCRPQTKTRWIGIALGFAAVVLIVSLYLGFHYQPLVRDLALLLLAKEIDFDFYLLDLVLQHAFVLMAFVLGTALFLYFHHARDLARSVAIAGLAVSLAGLAVIVGNYEETGFPLAVFLAILLIDAVITAAPVESHTPDLLRASLLLLGAVLVVASLGSGALAYANGLYQRLYGAPRNPVIHSAALSGFVPIDDDAWYAGYLNDGLVLLRTHLHSGDTVLTVDSTDPFAFALHIPPPAGGTTLIRYGTTFNDFHWPPAQRLFGSADLVMMPRAFPDPDLRKTVPPIYGPYLLQHFHLIGESNYWRLYRSATPSP